MKSIAVIYLEHTVNSFCHTPNVCVDTVFRYVIALNNESVLTWGFVKCPGKLSCVTFSGFLYALYAYTDSGSTYIKENTSLAVFYLLLLPSMFC